MEVGLNLFSIKNLLSTEKDYFETLKKLKEMGYSFVQFSGAPLNPEMIKKGIEESGLPVVLTHVPLDRILNDTDKLIEEHFSFGCKNIGLGAINEEFVKEDSTWRKTVDKLNSTAEKIKNAGGKFFYHHHHYEFHKLDNGQTVFDYMVENAPNINFTVDTYWLQFAGQNPITFVDKINGRMECVHLKDYRIDRKQHDFCEFKPGYAPVGTGSLDFKGIIENYKKLGTKYFLVEQDDASTYDNPLEQVKISIDYLKNI